MVEIDEVVIDPRRIERIKRGDHEEARRLRAELQELELSSHCLAGVPGDVYTLRQLEELGLVDAVRIIQNRVGR